MAPKPWTSGGLQHYPLTFKNMFPNYYLLQDLLQRTLAEPIAIIAVLVIEMA
jgi:hypothetical protein